MAILKNIIIGAALAASLTSCYTDFVPEGKDSDPVLCMNSLITADETIDVFLTHTWRYDDTEYGHFANTSFYGSIEKLRVSDALVKLYINDQYVEDLTYTEWTEYDITNSREERGAFRSTAKPKAGDRVKIVAESKQYGSAEAEITMPLPVAIDKVEYSAEPKNAYVSQISSSETGYDEILRFDLTLNVQLTDPADQTNYYFISTSSTVPVFDDWHEFEDRENYSPIYFSASHPNYNSEPLFSEHISIIEDLLDSYPWGCTYFTDTQISGKPYSLHLVYESLAYYATNYKGNSEYYNVSLDAILYTITDSYYKWLVYKWQDDEGLKGMLSDSGFGDSLLGYSNVSSGAGVVVGRTPYTYKVNLKDFLQTFHNNADKYPNGGYIEYY